MKSKNRKVGRPKRETEAITLRVSPTVAAWLRSRAESFRQTLGGVVEELISERHHEA